MKRVFTIVGVIVVTAVLVLAGITFYRFQYPLRSVSLNNIEKVEYKEFVEIDHSGSISYEHVYHELDLEEGIEILKQVKRNSTLYRGVTLDVYYEGGATLVYTYEDGTILTLDEQGKRFTVYGDNIITKSILLDEETIDRIYEYIR